MTIAILSETAKARDTTNRNTKTKGQVNDLRKKGGVPGIIYGGENANEKISLTKKEVKNLCVDFPLYSQLNYNS